MRRKYPASAEFNLIMWVTGVVFGVYACAALITPEVQTTVDTVAVLCDVRVHTLGLRESPALQAEAERLGVPLGTLLDLVCQAPALYDAFVRARSARHADPGAAVVEAMRGAR